MAQRIPQNVIDEVLGRVPIVQVIGDYVKLQRKGNRLVGLCPFHDEKTPSFSVNADRNVYHCFGCGASGNTVSFLMQHDGLSFREAMEQLAGRAGVVLQLQEEDRARARQNRDARQAYFDATAFAQELFTRALWSGRWEEPLAYLEQRGISREVAERFGLGWAPPEWTALVDAAARVGLGPNALEQAGLAVPRRSGGGHVDRFRGRVMFPIHDLGRKVLAFSGRTLDPEERAKYVNSPETEHYTKGRTLFGLPFAQRAIREKGAAILVEGNFDVVSLHARGFSHTCAALGTALTPEQAHLLRRFTDRVFLVYDGDRAGEAAARKALEALLAVDMPEVRWVRLPDGTDPDDLVRSGGADALRHHLDRAPPMVDALLDEAILPAAGATDPTARRAAAESVAEILRHVRDPLQRELWLADASQRLQVDARRLQAYLRQRPAADRRDPPRPAGDATQDRLPPLTAHESMLVEALADDPTLLGQFHREELHRVLPSPPLARCLEAVARAWTEEGGVDLRTAVVALPPEDAVRAPVLAVLAAERRIEPGEHGRVYADVSCQLKRAWLDREMQRVREALRQLSSDAPEAEMVALMERSRELMVWRQRLDPQPLEP